MQDKNSVMEFPPSPNAQVAVAGKMALVCATVWMCAGKWLHTLLSHPALGKPQGFSWGTVTNTFVFLCVFLDIGGANKHPGWHCQVCGEGCAGFATFDSFCLPYSRQCVAGVSGAGHQQGEKYGWLCQITDIFDEVFVMTYWKSYYKITEVLAEVVLLWHPVCFYLCVY